MTVDVCEQFHKEFCHKLEEHDRQAKDILERTKNMEGTVKQIIEAQAAQSVSLAAQAASQEKTQGHLEAASEALELAARTVAENSKWQQWAQNNLASSQSYRMKENWRLIGIIAAFVTVLLGLKALGIDI